MYLINVRFYFIFSISLILIGNQVDFHRWMMILIWQLFWLINIIYSLYSIGFHLGAKNEKIVLGEMFSINARLSYVVYISCWNMDRNINWEEFFLVSTKLFFWNHRWFQIFWIVHCFFIECYSILLFPLNYTSEQNDGIVINLVSN